MLLKLQNKTRCGVLANMSYVGSVNLLSAYIGLDLYEQAVKKGLSRATTEAEDSLNRMEEDLSNEDLVSAYVDRWVANQWLKARK